MTATCGSKINHLSLQTSTLSTCGANTSFHLFSLLQFISSIPLFWYSAQPLCWTLRLCCVLCCEWHRGRSDTSCQSVQTETYLHFRPPPLDPICHPDFLKINLDTVWIWHTTDLGLKGLGDVNFISSRVGSGYLQVVMTVLNCHLGHNGTISYKICLCMCRMRPQSGNKKVV